MKERSTVCTTLAQRHQRSSSWCLRPACTTRNHPRTGSKGTPRKNEHEPTFSQWGFSRASQNGACHEEKKGLQREAFSSSLLFLLRISARDHPFYLSWKVFFLEMFHSLKGSLHRFLFQIPVWSLSISNSLEDEREVKLWGGNFDTSIYFSAAGWSPWIVQCNTATYRNIWREDYQRIGTRHHYYSRYLVGRRWRLEPNMSS